MTGESFRLRRLLCSLPLIALGCSGTAAPGVNAEQLDRAIDLEARKLIDQRLSDCFVIGVVQQGRTYVRGFGGRPTGASPPDGRSVFQIGSLTKLFTVATLMSLAADGVVSLDDDLNSTIGGRFELAPAAGAITLRQLASHTSGLPRVPRSLMSLPRDDADPYRGLSPEIVFRYLRTAEGLGRPGSQDYSNYGVGLLGHVLEAMTGASLEQLFQSRILAPLAMSSTFMTPQEGPIDPLIPGVSEQGMATPAWRFGALAGAGALCSTVNDLLAFVQASLSSSGNLGPILQAMRQERGPKGARLGWFAPTIFDRMAGNKGILWHNGRVGGYASYLSVDIARQTGVVLLSAKSAEITMPGIMVTKVVRDYQRAP